MSRSEVIMYKNPKMKIDDDFVLKALETHDTALGFAVAKDGLVLNSVFDPAEGDLLEILQKTQDQYIDEQVFFHLSKAAEDEFSAESLQPFNILTRKKGEETDTLLSVMLDGDFTPYFKKGPHTPAYNMVQGYLAEKVQNIYKKCGSDLEKTCEELDSTTIRKDLGNLLVPRGVMIFIPGKGKSFAISNNKLGGVYKWGYATRTLGIDPPVAAPVLVAAAATPEVIGRPLTLREKQARRLALEKAQEKPNEPLTEKEKPVVSVPTVKPTTPPPVQLTGSEYIIMKGDQKWVIPPRGATWKEAKGFWNRHTTMNRPKDPKTLLEGFPASALRPNSSLMPFVQGKSEAMADAMRDAISKAGAVKETREKAATNFVEVEIPGIMSADQKKAVVGLRKNTSLWTSQQEMMEQTKNFPKYSEQTQIPFKEIVYAKTQFFMSQEKPAIINALNEVRRALIETWKELDAVKLVAAPAEPAAVEATAPPPKRPMTLAEKKKAREEAERKAA